MALEAVVAFFGAMWFAEKFAIVFGIVEKLPELSVDMDKQLMVTEEEEC